MSGDYNFTFSRLEPCFTNAERTGVCHLVVGLTCTFTGIMGAASCCESAYIDKTFCLDETVSYDYLTGNLSDLANNFATQENWWETLKPIASGRAFQPIQGGNIQNSDGLIIEAIPVQ
jgi:hypothetical protein